VAFVAGALVAAAAPAHAQAREDGGFVEVVEVSGLLDPVLVDFVEETVERAEREGAVALVLQLNSSGAVVSDDRFVELAQVIDGASMPVAVWVGTSGAVAYGAAAELVGIADISGMAPGTRLGRMGQQRLPESEFGLLFGDQHDRLVDGTVGSTEALEAGIITPLGDAGGEAGADGDDAPETVAGAPTVGDLIVNIEGVEVDEVEVEGQTRREPVTVVLFSQLPLPDQLAHTVASANVAYLLLTIGLALLVFELFTAGVGVAGLVGAGSLVLACYGLAVLPTNWWAFGLVVASMVAFSVDVQTGVPRVWTAIGMVLFAIGSFTLFSGVEISWITLVAAFIGILLTFTTGMPAMVRTRFSTPTIGRDWMIGEMGQAVADVAPQGTVLIRDALWRAETNRATPIRRGEPVRVVAIEGLVLEVEPEEGGARDYRERRSG
jgi:membrane-bound serine protease (ClpP class)